MSIETRRDPEGNIDYDYYRRRATVLRAEARRHAMTYAGRWVLAAARRLMERLVTVLRSQPRLSSESRGTHGT